MSNTTLLPGNFSVTLKAKDLGAAVSQENPAYRNGFGASLRLVGAAFVSKAGITGDATNYNTVSLLNKGLLGAGTTPMASKAFDTPGDDDVPAYGSGALDLAAAEADRILAPGEVMSIDKAASGTGAAFADDLVELTFQFGS